MTNKKHDDARVVARPDLLRQVLEAHDSCDQTRIIEAMDAVRDAVYPAIASASNERVQECAHDWISGGKLTYCRMCGADAPVVARHPNDSLRASTNSGQAANVDGASHCAHDWISGARLTYCRLCGADAPAANIPTLKARVLSMLHEGRSMYPGCGVAIDAIISRTTHLFDRAALEVKPKILDRCACRPGCDEGRYVSVENRCPTCPNNGDGASEERQLG